MENQWPVLSYEKGKLTYETLHMWTQIIGKIKMATLPWINHSWHVTLHITPMGLTTMAMPYKDQNFQIDFDFIVHQLKITTSTGQQRQFDLHGLSVASFYQKTMAALKELNIEIHIWTVPSEVENPLRFELDNVHATYDEAQVAALHLVWLRLQDVFIRYRSEFKCKTSPVHLFWGSFDVALSLFSGRVAPKHPGGIPGLPDWVAQEAYCREVCSCGFWPGSDALPEAMFYSYIYPEPKGYKDAYVQPVETYYHDTLGEYVLPYAAVQQAESPSIKLLQFLHSTYRAAVTLANWDRQDL